jgi:hypothetical protein
MINITCLFCDDIRSEDNGKRILVGVYDKDLITAQLPLHLAQLHFAITIEAIGVDLPVLNAIRVESPGSVPWRRELENSRLGPISHDDATDRSTAHLFLPAGPFEFMETGVLRVYLETDKGELLGGVLRLRTIEELAQDPAERAVVVDVGVIMTTLQHYRRAKSRKARDQRGLAHAILEFLLDYLPESALAGGDAMKPTQISPRQNFFRVFFDQPRLKAPVIQVKPASDGEQGRVTQVDKYGFEVQFPPKARVERLDFEVVD